MSVRTHDTNSRVPTPSQEITQLLWDARQGAAENTFLVYDSAEIVILAFETTDAFPNTESTRAQHTDATREWAQHNDIKLPPAEAYLLIQSEFDQNWSLRIAEKYDRQLTLLDYRINFNDTKWDQYDVCVSGYAEIPGIHGTLRKEVKVQGFPSHRSNSEDTVKIWESLSHRETGHVFYSDETDSYVVPDATDYKSYPLVPVVLVSVYNALFSDVPDYTELITDEFTVCRRCGVYDESHSEHGVTVQDAIDPNDGWQRKYCETCYIHVLHNEYGVLTDLAELYVKQQRGASITELATEYGQSERHVTQMLDKLDDAVKHGNEF